MIANHNAVTVVLEVYEKIYSKNLDLGYKLLNKEIESNKFNFQEFYSLSWKLYFIDFFIWTSICHPRDDLFY